MALARRCYGILSVAQVQTAVEDRQLPPWTAEELRDAFVYAGTPKAIWDETLGPPPLPAEEPPPPAEEPPPLPPPAEEPPPLPPPVEAAPTAFRTLPRHRLRDRAIDKLIIERRLELKAEAQERMGKPGYGGLSVRQSTLQAELRLHQTAPAENTGYILCDFKDLGLGLCYKNLCFPLKISFLQLNHRTGDKFMGRCWGGDPPGRR